MTGTFILIRMCPQVQKRNEYRSDAILAVTAGSKHHTPQERRFPGFLVVNNLARVACLQVSLSHFY